MHNQSSPPSEICPTHTIIEYEQLILDFLNEIVQRPTVLIGNSVGSLACVIAASAGMLGFSGIC